MKMKNLFFAITLTAIASGCTVDTPYGQNRTSPIRPVPNPVRTSTRAEANFSATSEISTRLRAKFVCSESEMTFCSKLAARLASSVVLDQAELVNSAPFDVKIMIDPEFELMDKTGNYYRIICNQISVTVSSDRKVYSKITIEPKALPRKLGSQNAKDQYLKAAARELAPFLKKELEKLSTREVAVSEVKFGLENVQENPDAGNIAGKVEAVSRILASTPGVINYMNIQQDVRSATCSFRIVYMRDHFPQGLSNYLNLKLAGK